MWVVGHVRAGGFARIIAPPQISYEQKKPTELSSLNSRRGGGSGGVKQGRFGICVFPCFVVLGGFQDNQMLEKTARKVSSSHPFLCASNASKN